MQWATVSRLSATCLFVGFLACGDDAPPNKIAPRADAGDEGECVDKDGDGFGEFCEEGVDCDDANPSVTDECKRCRWHNKGCPCEPGTDWEECDPPDRRGDGGVYVCTEGTRYCRLGHWSACEVVGDYVFQPDP